MKYPMIRSLENLETIISSSSKPLCLYSGGLDGTYLLYRLSKLSCSQVTALTLDLGGNLQIDIIQQMTHSLGAECIIENHCTNFAKDFILPAISAHSTYLGGHPICASLSRPLMAYRACEVAQKHGCDIIIHTSNRSQNSLRRFNGALASLNFPGYFGSPFELSSISRQQKITELSTAGIHFSNEKIYSTDINLWGREFEYGDTDDPENIHILESLYQWTKVSNKLDSKNICISFKNGIPTVLGEEKNLVSMIQELNSIIGAYGLGRYIWLEEIDGGVKVQEIHEMPAAFILFDAYRRLETACINAECIREKMVMEQLWVREAVEGRWYEPLRYAAQAFIQTMAQKVTGSVCYKLDKFNFQVISVKAEKPLYIRDRSQFDCNG